MSRSNFIRAKEGYKFSLTEFGVEEPRIRTKFETGSVTLAQYEKAVPKSWIDKGYVKEVKRE